MSQVIADITKYASTEDCYSDIPVPIKDSVCELVEWCCKYNE